MTNPRPPLDSWERRHYQPGGGDAFLFYVVYGRIDTAAPMSRSKCRSEGIPPELDVMSYGPGTRPEVPGSFREGYLWEGIQKSDPALAATIAKQDSCLVLRGTFADPPNLNYLRETIGIVTHFLDNGGVAVFDPHMFRWWSPEMWREHIFSPAGPVPRHHTTVLVSEESGGTEWLHTRGLRKFGRPDLSVPNVPGEQKEAFVELCNRFIELQAFGGIIPEGQEIRVSSLPEGLICRHAGDLEDPDFNNVHVRIACETSHSVLAAFITDRFSGPISPEDAVQLAFRIFCTVDFLPESLRELQWTREKISEEFSNLALQGMIQGAERIHELPEYWDAMLTELLANPEKVDEGFRRRMLILIPGPYVNITADHLYDSVAQVPFGNFEPFISGNREEVWDFYAGVFAALEELPNVCLFREVDHHGSGYASYVSAFLYPADESTRKEFPTYVETTGLLLYMSRLAPIAVFGANSRTQNNDNRGSSSGFISTENVGKFPDGDWTVFLNTITDCLRQFLIEFLPRGPLLKPAPSEINIPTVFDGPYRVFDTLFYWCD